MGTNSSLESVQINTQRIRPGPGISGYKNRKSSISIYSEQTHSIFTVQIKPKMTVWEVKKQLPLKNVELKVASMILKNNQTLEELGVDNLTVIKIAEVEKYHIKSNSTSDSLPDSEGFKIIGPKKMIVERPEKPSNDSTLSVVEDTFGINLKSFAVPDAKLGRNLSRTIMKG